MSEEKEKKRRPKRLQTEYSLVSFRFPNDTVKEVTEIAAKTGLTRTMVVVMAIDRMYVEKRKEGAL